MSSSGYASAKALRWVAPLLNYSGYAYGARYFPRVLVKAGMEVQTVPRDSDAQYLEQMSAPESLWWTERMQVVVKDSPCVITATPVTPLGGDVYRAEVRRNKDCSSFIGYLATETPRVSTSWIDACLQMDEVWVPSTFCRKSLISSGMPSDRVHNIPIGIDFSIYEPETATPLPIIGAKGFVFLSVFEWSLRKGWDVLLRAYHMAFSADDDVTLVIRSYRRGRDQRWIEAQVRDFENSLGIPERRRARVVLLGRFVPESHMASLYAAADAYVLPSRSEGWGIPYLEAMAMQLPTVGSAWGGNLDFMRDHNSYLVPCRELPVPRAGWNDNPNACHYRGHVWAEPDPEVLAQQLRSIASSPEVARAKGRQASTEVRQWLAPERIAGQILQRLEAVENRAPDCGLIPHRLLQRTRGPARSRSENAPIGAQAGTTTVLLVGRPDVWQHASEDTTYLWCLQQRMQQDGIRVVVDIGMTPDANGYETVYIIGGRDTLTMTTQVAAARATCSGRLVLVWLPALRRRSTPVAMEVACADEPSVENRPLWRHWLAGQVAAVPAAADVDVEAQRLERFACELADLTAGSAAELPQWRYVTTCAAVPALPAVSARTRSATASRPRVLVAGTMTPDWNLVLVLDALHELDVQVDVLSRARDMDFASLCRRAAPPDARFVESSDPADWARLAQLADVYVVPGPQASADPLRYLQLHQEAVTVMPDDCPDLTLFGALGFGFRALDPQGINDALAAAVAGLGRGRAGDRLPAELPEAVIRATKPSKSNGRALALSQLFMAKARNQFERIERVVEDMGEELRADPEWQLLLGELLLTLGQNHSAQRCFEQSARHKDYNAVAKRRFAHLELLENNYARAQEQLAQLLEQHPGDRYFLQDLGEIALLQERPKDALSLLSQAERQEPDNLICLLHLADAQRLCGEHEAAATNYARALALDGNRVQVVARLLQYNLEKPVIGSTPESQKTAGPTLHVATTQPVQSSLDGINVIGHISGNLGIGVTARSVIQALLDRGIEVATIDIDPGMGRAGADRSLDHLAVQRFEDLPHAINLFVLPPASIAALHRARPDFFECGHLNVGFSMWELPAVPREWVPALEALDVLVAESEFIRHAFQVSLSGVQVLSAPHPLYLPSNVRPQRERFGLPVDGVIFLSSFEPNSDVERKNPEAVVQAFLRGVGQDPRAHLVFKLNNATSNGMLRPSVAALRLYAERHPRIHLLTDTLRYEEVLALYASCDVFVSLHRAEGLGLALLECMALGKPVVATGWSGNVSFMDHTCSALVGYDLIPVNGTIPAYQAEMVGDQVRWADPNIDEAAAWLSRLLDDPALRADMGARARSHVEHYLAEAGQAGFIDELAHLWAQRDFREGGSLAITKPRHQADTPRSDFERWLETRDVRASEPHWLAELTSDWNREPWFQVVSIMGPGQEALLADTLDSLGAQVYGGWRFTVFSSVAAPDETFAQHPQLEWRRCESEPSLSECLNRVAAETECEWLLSLPLGDRIDPRALLLFADASQHAPQVQLWYCDEDQISAVGERSEPAFKPDFNIDLLRSWPYFGDAVVVRRQAVIDLEGYRPFSGAENYDLALRLWQRHGDTALAHLPKLLYHALAADAREDELSVFIANGLEAVADHLQCTAPEATVEPAALPGTHRIRYPLAEQPPVSIIVPTRNAKALLAACVESLQEQTGYANFELLVVDNGSDEEDTLAYLASLPERFPNTRVLRFAGEYNFSAINNFAARQARGDYLLLLNNDTQVVHGNWLDELMAQAQRPGVGVVGARLLFPDGKIQHAGVVTGMGANGVAEHPCVGLAHDEPGYLARAQVTQQVSAVTGACLLVSKSLYQQLGGLDERHLPVMYNDIDLCLKTRALGLAVVWTPFATLIHHGSVSLKEKQYTDRERKSREAEIALMLERWPEQLAADPFYNRNLSLKNGGCEVDVEVAVGWDRDRALRPRILGMGFGSDGSWEHRVVAPLQALEAAGTAETGLLPKYKDRVRVPSVSELLRERPDTLLLHNCVHDVHLEALSRYRRHGKTFLVFGQDDLMVQLPVSNPFRDKVYKDIKQRLRKAMGLCDRLVVTTEPLADAYRKMAADIVVQPNYLPTSVWGEMSAGRRHGAKPRVGWAGAQQHVGDLALIMDVVKQTAKEIDWVFFGLCFEELLPYVAEVVDPVPFAKYPETLAALDLDLAVAPLEQNRFNECKSNLKVLEYGAVGVPVVCTDIAPYQSAPVARVANRTADWAAAIRERVADRDALAAEGERLRQWVHQHWLLEDRLDAWLAALSPSAVAAAAEAGRS